MQPVSPRHSSPLPTFSAETTKTDRREESPSPSSSSSSPAVDRQQATLERERFLHLQGRGSGLVSAEQNAQVQKVKAVMEEVNITDKVTNNTAGALFFDIQHNGLGHVLWGSKPVFWLTDEQFDAIALIQQNRTLKENFILLKNAPNKEGKGSNSIVGGLLINKYNLRKVITDNHDLFTSCLSAGKNATPEQILAQFFK